MTDEEFFARVEVKLGADKFEKWEDSCWEDRMLRLYAIICEVRAIEREVISRNALQRKDIHPVCHH